MANVHDEHEALNGSAKRPGWLAGVAILVVVLAGTAVYAAICTALGIVPIWAGFVFALYWGGMLGADLKAMPPALTGALLGIALGAGLHLAPLAWGQAGNVAAIGIVLIVVYLLLIQRATFAVNNATMLFLTIATIPAVAAERPFAGMAGAALVAAAILGGLSLVMAALAKRKARLA